MKDLRAKREEEGGNWVGSTSSDSINLRLKVFEKNTESSTKQNFYLLYVGNYLHNLYMALGIRSNPAMV